MSDSVVIAAALDGAGWHPAAWRLASAEPRALTTLDYWRRLVGTAEEAGIDFVTVEDAFAIGGGALTADGTPDAHRVGGRLDALLIASALAGTTTSIGLVPTVTTTHTEPFHVATGLQTLDHASRGRGGWRVQASPLAAEAALFGRRSIPRLTLDEVRGGAGDALIAELFGEAADVIEVVRRLWDSWEDDAVIRDVATGRYLDRDRIHNVDFEGERFGVTGASIVPRPPQGQLPVTLLAHRDEPYELAATGADVVYVTPQDDGSAAGILRSVRDAEARVGRTREPLKVYADLLVLLGDTEEGALAELARLDDLAGSPLESDALVVATTADALADLVGRWSALGYSGFRLRPARLPLDLERIGRDLLNSLRARGLRDSGSRTPAQGATLRERLGLPAAPNRHTARRPAVRPQEEVVA